jgi:hypothetical protein
MDPYAKQYFVLSPILALLQVCSITCFDTTRLTPPLRRLERHFFAQRSVCTVIPNECTYSSVLAEVAWMSALIHPFWLMWYG